ncbi:DUF1501 domain-containing protein [Planctomycetales bacterium ZRK34]|nr:DUF1501 domain-containing protein [Planctomycetales bacterium ZRK34]
MNLRLEHAKAITRRHFFGRTAQGIGGMALASLLAGETRGAGASTLAGQNPMAPKRPMFAPKAKRVIYLHMAGSPPQHELFDYKPTLVKHNGEPCPDEFLKKARFAFIKGHPRLLGTPYKFKQYGQAGTWVSELLPHFASIVDDVAVIKSMHTDQFNHAPAQLFVHTGNARLGYPAIGSWATYGLGSENQNLPGFVVLVSGGKDPSAGKSVWGSGFLPSVFQGVQCRTSGDPVLYLSDPAGMNTHGRRRMLDAVRELNEYQHASVGDPETLTRIAQYELAYRMQIAVPEVMDITRESKATLQMYNAEPGAQRFANNCLLARRLVESGVRYVQLFDWGWDFHGTNRNTDITLGLKDKAREIDQPIAALIGDLKQRGLLDETLVVWSGEFGRTSMNENRGGNSKFLGRDHHPNCFTIWMAGGGIKPGLSVGETDDLGYFIAENPVSVRDLQATMLHQLGLDPHKFSHPFQGLNARLIGPTEEANVRHDLLL